jgi:hypothetical protein
VEMAFPSKPSLEVSRIKWKLIIVRKLPFVVGTEMYLSIMTAAFV